MALQAPYLSGSYQPRGQEQPGMVTPTLFGAIREGEKVVAQLAEEIDRLTLALTNPVAHVVGDVAERIGQ